MEAQEKLEKGCFYHIYNRGNNKDDLFIEDENYVYFLSLLSKYLLPISIVYAYCLLKNHFHLLIQIKEETEIEEEKLHQPFSNLFNAYSKAFNKKYGRDGSLFKTRFKRNKIEDENQLMNTVLYIHLNPVKHGFTEKFAVYKYSSFQSIISERVTNLRRKDILQLFGDKQNFIDAHQIRIVEKFDLEF